MNRCLACFLALFCFLISLESQAQAYFHGSYTHHLRPLPVINGIMQRFNESANHSLSAINSFDGYQFGIGSYGWFTFMELNYGNLVARQQSRNTSQLLENAELVFNQATVNLNLGLRPFLERHFIIGTGICMGQTRVRYSFGGDYAVAVQPYVLSFQLFSGYAFKSRFLLKKERRPDYYYLIRIRAYYQFQQSVDMAPLERQLNGTSIVPGADFDEGLSSPGLQVSLIAPLMKGGKVVERGGSGAREQARRARQLKRYRRQRKRELRNLDWDSPSETED